MKILSSILIAMCLLATPAMFTGCATNQSREAVIFYTFKDVQIIVHRAYDVFAEKVVLGKVSPAEKAKVEDAYVRYQDAYRVAFNLARLNPDSITPADVQRLADEVIKLIYKL